MSRASGFVGFGFETCSFRNHALQPVILQKLALIISFPAVRFGDMLFVLTGFTDSYFISFPSMPTTTPPPENTPSGG